MRRSEVTPEMETSKENALRYGEKLQKARFSLMKTHPFYAVLLMHVAFSLDSYAETAYTDGKSIVFAPDFLDKLSLDETCFILMHEVMHIVLNHCNRKMENMDASLFNAACDIVVNSNILHSFNGDVSKISLKEYGESMHLTPNGKEGCLFTMEEVYRMLEQSQNKQEQGGFDDHSFWENDGDEEEKEQWKQFAVEAKKAQDQWEAMKKDASSLPSLLERQIDAFVHPQTPWRELLQDLIQVDIVDYSFNPPDRRMQETSLILPDFNEKEEEVKNVWFVVDTSGSVSQKQLTAAFSEIQGALDQFHNHLEAYISFFDASITEPKKFTSSEEFQLLKPLGGGGTSFRAIFDKIDAFFQESPPSCIVILTDGEADYPEQEASQNIPVLWLINNEEITPPWGKIGRIQIDD